MSMFWIGQETVPIEIRLKIYGKW